MNSGVPTTSPVSCVVASCWSPAIPKSATRARPVAASGRMLSGFTSRCTTPSSTAEPDAPAPASHELHAEEHVAVPFVHREDRHDVRMRQPGGGPGLAEEPFAETGHRGEGGREELEGHESVNAHLPGQIDDAHPSSPKLALERVSPSEGGLEGDEQVVVGRRTCWRPAVGLVHERYTRSGRGCSVKGAPARSRAPG